MINKLRKEIDLIYEEVVAFRRYLHENPELGFEVDRTYDFIWKTLKKIKIDPIKCGQKGIIGYIGKKKNVKKIILRADIDALEIEEATSLEFKSLNKNMHACGHDMHTAILLGSAKILKKYEDELNIVVKLVFEPAEELLEGAKDMIDDGVISDVDCAFMIHVLSGINYPTGTVILPSLGISAPSSDFFEINIFGASSHGAMPEKGIDPIVTTSHIILGLDNLLTREKAISDNAIITIGQIKGGNSFNVIPSLITLKGSMRTYDQKLRKKFKQRIKDVVQGFSHSFRCEASVDFISGCPPLVNDENIYHKVKSILEKCIKENLIINSINEKSSGSEDFSYISNEVPSMMIAISAGSLKEGYRYPLHHPKVIFNEEALKTGILIYTLIAFMH